MNTMERMLCEGALAAAAAVAQKDKTPRSALRPSRGGPRSAAPPPAPPPMPAKGSLFAGNMNFLCKIACCEVDLLLRSHQTRALSPSADL